MASRRKLKQAIHTEVEEMLFDLSILYSVAPEEREYAIEQLIMKVIDAERDFVARISHTQTARVSLSSSATTTASSGRSTRTSPTRSRVRLTSSAMSC
ncbi:hypothetical protein [uncultured Porphyromonas sp.]|uniref:hypothetical protein n=1 Tax=uncultured Porphyromonas sp. TaxID=159274 RepID=UPI0025FE6B35|nr:hypothetical protein [uncultured Porphyromonas sp.]